jgi:hypothetical protein
MEHTAMHLEVHETSPGVHALMHCSICDCAEVLGALPADVLLAIEPAVVVPLVDWAVTRAAKAPTRIAEKRILT